MFQSGDFKQRHLSVHCPDDELPGGPRATQPAGELRRFLLATIQLNQSVQTGPLFAVR